MKHFKRRCKDARQIIKELRDLVTWKNFIFAIPAIMLFTPIMLFWLLFENYEESDKWEREITEYLKQQEQ
jgi:hypothetical protein